MDDTVIKIKELIKVKKMTYKEISEELNVSERTIANYMSGRTKVDVEVLRKFSALLGVSLGLLIGESMNKSENKAIQNANGNKNSTLIQNQNGNINYEGSNSDLYKEIKYLRKEIEAKDEIIKIQKELIEQLKNKLF